MSDQRHFATAQQCKDMAEKCLDCIQTTVLDSMDQYKPLWISAAEELNDLWKLRHPGPEFRNLLNLNGLRTWRWRADSSKPLSVNWKQKLVKIGIPVLDTEFEKLSKKLSDAIRSHINDLLTQAEGIADEIDAVVSTEFATKSHLLALLQQEINVLEDLGERALKICEKTLLKIRNQATMAKPSCFMTEDFEAMCSAVKGITGYKSVQRRYDTMKLRSATSGLLWENTQDAVKKHSVRMIKQLADIMTQKFLEAQESTQSAYRTVIEQQQRSRVFIRPGGPADEIASLIEQVQTQLHSMMDADCVFGQIQATSQSLFVGKRSSKTQWMPAAEGDEEASEAGSEDEEADVEMTADE